MEIRSINQEISVAPQITAGDIAEIASMGFKTVISNRPDEEMGAVPHGEIEQAATAAGLKFYYVPVISGGITQDDVQKMKVALGGAEQPVLAYCRSGQRSTYLYGFVQQERLRK